MKTYETSHVTVKLRSDDHDVIINHLRSIIENLERTYMYMVCYSEYSNDRTYSFCKYNDVLFNFLDGNLKLPSFVYPCTREEYLSAVYEDLNDSEFSGTYKVHSSETETILPSNEKIIKFCTADLDLGEFDGFEELVGMMS